MKILIAENDEDSRVYLERALTSQDYTVESAPNGVLALEKALLSPPDMIISDIMMPEMDGFDFCRKVKANEKLQHIPFIFYTATFINKKDEELAMSLGASRFIVKPVEMQEFFKIVNKVIEEHKKKKLPVPGKALVEDDKLDEMYSETIARKLDRKVAQLQHEIAEHKQAEEAHSDARYRLLYESMTDCFVQVAMSGEIVEANRSYLEMLGYTEEEVRKLRYQELTPAQWHESDNKIIETQVMARGYSDIYEQEYIKKDGTVFPVELRTYLLRNTDGKPFGMWTIIRDITARKRADEKLRETTVYTRSLIEASLDPLVMISPQGKITDVNKATELATGLPREKLIGSDFSGYFTEPGKASTIYQHVFDKGFIKDYSLAIRHISGSTIDVLYNASVYKNSAGNVGGVFAAARDITERKRSEEERIQLLAREQAALAEAEAARKLDKLKSMFIASTSHELRTPLNSIIGFSSMLLQGFSGELNPEEKFQLEIVHSAGKHLLSLISDVIDISKIEAGKIDLEVSEVELKQVVDEAVSTLGPGIKEKGILLSVEVEDITIRTDRKRLLQCIINIIGNAAKYTEKGSIKITGKITGNNVDFSVIDTGIGIKKEDIPKLFNPFVRLHTPLTEKIPGTGLGLYLVKKLAKDFLGGDVKVESEFGVGSKFTLNMPIELEKG